MTKNKQLAGRNKSVCVVVSTISLAYLPHRSAQLLVGHLGVLLALAPHLGHLVRLHELEHAVLAPFPPDEAGIGVLVEQQVANELPQLTVYFVCAVGGLITGYDLIFTPGSVLD